MSKDLRLFVYLMRQDDPRKCTSAKLVRLGLAKPLHRISSIPRGSVLLNPNADQVFSKMDAEFIKLHGLVAVDCSWKNVSQVFFKELKGRNMRLPSLLAGNPTSYGMLGKLSTVEALAAALHISGFIKKALQILFIYKWGETFLTLNKELLQEYGKAESREELFKVERAYFQSTQT